MFPLTFYAGHTGAVVLLCTYCIICSVRAQIIVPLNNTSFRAALDLYKANQTSATATYGHISEWDTSKVTDMSELELGPEFVVGISDLAGWDTSRVTDMSEASFFFKTIQSSLHIST